VTVETLFNELQLLRIENASLKTLCDKALSDFEFNEKEVARLNENLRLLKRQVFGPRKERWLSETQPDLFNEAEVLVAKVKEEEITVPAHKRRRGKRLPLPKDLPREVVVLDIPENEKVAPDGSPLRVMGKEVSEKLVSIPAQLKIVEYHRLKYGGAEGKDTVKIARPIPSIIPKGIATPSLLATIITDKYGDGLPLYRQEERFGRHGIDLSRSSMGRWIVKASDACQGVWNALEEKLLLSPYVSCDETRVQVLKEDGRLAEAQSWMWIRSTPQEKGKIVLFDYDPSRSGDVPKKLFADYRGYLQTDGYGGYNAVSKNEGVTHLGCNMHGRRKFHEASLGSEKGQSLAKQGLDCYQRLSDIEEKTKDLSYWDRFVVREKEARPIWIEMKIWAEKHYPMVPPKSKIGAAFHYFLAQYDLLISYLSDGLLQFDNGFAERAIKYFAIGRKNWLFSDTVEGAKASSLFYSFVITAKVNGVNPWEALNRIFTEVPTASTADDYDRIASYLLPPRAT
jgi:transposase